MSSVDPPTLTPLAPLPYHREVVAFLKETEPELWQWASSANVREEEAAELRAELLKTHYRLDADAHPELAERGATVARRMGVTTRITLYQARGGLSMNAAIFHLPGEAHITLIGPVLTALKDAELEALLAHELAHFQLWEMDGGDFLVADRLLSAAANDPRAVSSHLHTARRYRLYTEVYADRGSFLGCGQLEASVAMLVKTETGLPEVSAASYLRQADEIFAHGETTTKGLDHPETFIRAKALRLWAENDPSLETWLKGTIEGPLILDDLDFAGQRRMALLTRRFLGELLRPRWFQTAAVLAHAQAFFPEFIPSSAPDETLPEALRCSDLATREYLCYLLLDFAVVDRELEDLPLAAALAWSQRLELSETFDKLAIKELGIGKRQLSKLKKEAPTMLKTAEVES